MTNEEIQNEMAEIVKLNDIIADDCKVQDIEIAELEAKLKSVRDVRNFKAEPYEVSIVSHQLLIKELVIIEGKTVKTEFGTVSFRKGSIRTYWDSKALEGYAAGGHDEILQFKKETEVKPSITIKME